MKRIGELTTKELWLYANVLADANETIERLVAYDDNTAKREGAVCNALMNSPDVLDQIVSDTYYHVNETLMQLYAEIERRRGGV